MGCNEENKRGQAPFLYFDYSGTEKSERWKKGACPLLFSPEGEKMPTYNEIENMEESLNLAYEKNNIKSSFHCK
jgi:hypothetical protein